MDSAPTTEPLVTEPAPAEVLKSLIAAGSTLVGSSKTQSQDASKTLAVVVKARLHEFNNASTPVTDLRLPHNALESEDVELLKILTATKSLEILERVQSLLQEYDVDLPANTQEASKPPVAVGTRDLGILRTLASIVFGWGVTPLLATLYSTAPIALSIEEGGTNRNNLLNQLKDFTSRLISLLWPSRNNASTSAQPFRLLPTHVTKIMISRHIVDIIRLSISVGWDLEAVDETIQQSVMALLKMIPASQAIVSLGTASQPIRPSADVPESSLRSTPVSVPPHVQKASSALLSQQVLRPDGISGLCAAVFGEGDEVAPLVKLERIARVLSAVPSQMNREAYMRTILPNLIILLSPVDSELESQSVPASYKRAAAFTLSRMLTVSRNLTLNIIAPIIHGRFLPSSSVAASAPPIPDTISTLTTLFTSTDPSPLLAQAVIEPILVPLYNLSVHLDAQRISDPTLKESVRGLLKTWARLVGRDEAIGGLWNIVEGVGGWGLDDEVQWTWDFGEEGLEIVRAGPPKPIPLSVLQGTNEAEDLRDDEDDNPLSLRPNPSHFANFLKLLGRKDVASSLFVRVLNEYQVVQRMNANPLRIMLFLRLVLELQQKLGSSVLTEPQHILQFVAHAIEPRADEPNSTPTDRDMNRLRIVETDSDDENDPEVLEEQNEMALTAVSLLLSILEANETLSTNSSPLLAMIFDYLEPLTSSENEPLRAISREARLVLISRRSLSDTLAPATDLHRSDLETYREALKLIQDPILPVRAHGLHMLRQLVVPPKSSKGATAEPLPELDPALVPGILDVFLQSVQEEDSFVFLNAVQGLSAMVDRLGREILQNLLRIYATGIQPGRPMERAELDKRIRVGEALVQVVRRCGDALGLYVDMIIPPLFQVVRAEGIPTVLRSSALSIIAQSVETSAIALTPWTDDILSGMIDILQVESVRATPLTRAAREQARADTKNIPVDQEIDARPQETDSKLPPLRRSALLCFAQVLRSQIVGAYEGSNHSQRDTLWSRSRTILEYLRITDSDSVVRAQAAETLGLLKQLGRAQLGIDV
ncbi:Required for nuclear transport of RNA pol II C-terminus 1 [Ceratobasidium sp. AG-Ba]|nr:Required for nuclear transport of RNA pol II C-terminus 1 [Ceratobasidium sp. AG-Ba]